jgi:outer membrane lipoprotein SlyB
VNEISQRDTWRVNFVAYSGIEICVNGNDGVEICVNCDDGIEICVNCDDGDCDDGIEICVNCDDGIEICVNCDDGIAKLCQAMKLVVSASFCSWMR